MKKIYLILATAISFTAFSQFTITKSANDFIAGNTINNRNFVGTPDHSAAGANVTFNNSALTDGSAITSTVSTPTPAEIGTFPNTTVKFEDGNGNKIYYKSSGSQLDITGATIGSTVVNFFAVNAIALKFPMSYGNMSIGTTTGTFTSTAASGKLKGNVSIEADAYGTLLLGSQTYNNVLRVKTVQNLNLYESTDNFYLFVIGTITNTIYTYYNVLLRYPVFTSTTSTISVPLLSINETNSAAFGRNSTTLSTEQNSVQNKIIVYPNPVKDDLFFAGDLENYSEVKIYNLEGKLVKSTTFSNKKLNLSKLSAGNYILELRSKTAIPKTIHFIKE